MSDAEKVQGAIDMREILFRGKHTHMFSSNKPLDGLWCYGYLVDKNYINDKTDRGDGEYLGEMFVDPETVGQYTGLTDKNGAKVFEGDILRWYRYEEGGANQVISFEYGSWVATEIRSKIACFLWSLHIGGFEVIGNIYDNPELMEVKG